MRRFLNFINMRRLLIYCAQAGLLFFALIIILPAYAQKVEDFRVFKHVGVDVGVSTLGIGFDVATPITNYLELRLGANFMPGFTVKGDVDILDAVDNIPTGPNMPNASELSDLEEVEIKGDFARTTFDLAASIYPFGASNNFFVVAGLSFGGQKIAKLKGHNDVIARYPDLRDYVVANLDKYNLKFNEQGDIVGDVRVNAVRPYLGLGFGRIVPKHRIGFRFELGCQFMGKMRVYQNGHKLNTHDDEEDGDDDLSKVIDKIKVYPVLKLVVAGRIL